MAPPQLQAKVLGSYLDPLCPDALNKLSCRSASSLSAPVMSPLTESSFTDGLLPGSMETANREALDI